MRKNESTLAVASHGFQKAGKGFKRALFKGTGREKATNLYS